MCITCDTWELFQNSEQASPLSRLGTGGKFLQVNDLPFVVVRATMLVTEQLGPAVSIRREGIGYNYADPAQHAHRRQLVVELFVVDSVAGLDDGEVGGAGGHVPVVDGRQPGWRRGETHGVCGLFARALDGQGVGLIDSRSLMSRLYIIMDLYSDWLMFLLHNIQMSVTVFHT